MSAYEGSFAGTCMQRFMSDAMLFRDTSQLRMVQMLKASSARDICAICAFLNRIWCRGSKTGSDRLHYASGDAALTAEQSTALSLDILLL